MKKIQNQTQTQKIQNQIQHIHNTNTSRKFILIKNTTYSQYKHTQEIQNQTQTQKIQNQTQTQKIKNQPQHTHNTNTPRNFKIKLNVLQNIKTQTHESPLIQQNQPKSNINSIQGKQMHKLRNTNL